MRSADPTQATAHHAHGGRLRVEIGDRQWSLLQADVRQREPSAEHDRRGYARRRASSADSDGLARVGRWVARSAADLALVDETITLAAARCLVAFGDGEAPTRQGASSAMPIRRMATTTVDLANEPIKARSTSRRERSIARAERTARERAERASKAPSMPVWRTRGTSSAPQGTSHTSAEHRASSAVYSDAERAVLASGGDAPRSALLDADRLAVAAATADKRARSRAKLKEMIAERVKRALASIKRARSIADGTHTPLAWTMRPPVDRTTTDTARKGEAVQGLSVVVFQLAS